MGESPLQASVPNTLHARFSKRLHEGLESFSLMALILFIQDGIHTWAKGDHTLFNAK